MFDFFWRFLYSISKIILKVCDWLMDVARVIIGIDDMTFEGSSTDFLTYLITSDRVKKAFGGMFAIAIAILFVFSILAILRTILKDNQGMSPAQICVKAFKSLVTFLFVPTIMVVLVMFITVVLQQVFAATSSGSSSIGTYMFIVFANDAGLSSSEEAEFLAGDLNFYKTSDVESAIEISDFNFIMSWIVGGFVLINIGRSLVSFVERAIGIVILYLAAPFCIASSVLDEGARFKTWREQILVKFLASCGTIVALNIYIMVCGLVMDSDVQFFTDWALNNVTKILIILGGAVSMAKANSLVATLISQAAATDVNDRNNEAGRALAGKMFGATPLGWAASAVGDAAGRKRDELKKKLGDGALSALGITPAGKGAGQGGGGGGGGKTVQGASEDSPNQNNNNPDTNKEEDLKEALEGNKENDENEKEKDNQNSMKDMLDNEDDNDIADRGDQETEDMQNELAEYR